MTEYYPKENRQRPLSVQWASKAAADYLKHHYGLGAGAAAIAFDLTRTPGDEVSYPRAKGHHSYVCARRYKNPIWTPGRIVGGMDQLERERLIHHMKRDPGNRSSGWQSSAQATPELVELVNAAITQEPLHVIRLRETIILRDAGKRPIDYRETRETRAMRKNLAAQNEAIIGSDISGCQVATMVRYFNQTMQRGGRFTARGDSWQNIARDMRPHVTISDEPTIELDYKTLHPAILYSMAGADLPHDSYALEGWPRDLVKLALLVTINAKNIFQAIGAIAHSDGRKYERDEGGNPIGFTHDRQLMQVLADPGTPEAEAMAKRLVASVKELHKPIAHFFGKDMGAQLMAIDSRMAEAVMMEMLDQGDVVLPVHDSFLVAASKAEKLEAAMMKAAHIEGIRALQIEAKTPKTPISPKQLKLL